MKRKTPAKTTVTQKHAARAKRWSADRLLTEARARTKALSADGERRVQHMLARLLKEAGWSNEDFLDALVENVSRRPRHSHA